jgi:hypothetical protein
MTVKAARIVTSLFIVVPLASAVGCSSDDDSAEEGSSANGGTKGIVIGAGGTTTGNATNPDPIPPGNTDGWTDITDEEKAAFVGQACDAWSAEPEALPSILEFVLDVSGTMRAETDSTGGLSKWEVSADALQYIHGERDSRGNVVVESRTSVGSVRTDADRLFGDRIVMN